MSSPAAEFQYSEAKLADELGVSRADIKFIRDRHLEADRDWKKTGGGFVALADTGVSKILEALGGAIDVDLTQCLLDSPNEDKPDQPESTLLLDELPKKNGVVKMVVSNIPLNPRVVLATDPSRNTCTVDVGNSCNFVVGDNIEVVPHSTQTGFWRFVGQMPRSRRRIEGRPV